MDQWKQSFLAKLNDAQSHWVKRFDEVMNGVALPVVEEFREFLSQKDFKVFSPFREEGRRSFKFELAENAYVLMIFRAVGVGEIELRCETFAPGNEPVTSRVALQMGAVSADWIRETVQGGLDTFVDLLAAKPVPANRKAAARERKHEPEPDLVEV